MQVLGILQPPDYQKVAKLQQFKSLKIRRFLRFRQFHDEV